MRPTRTNNTESQQPSEMQMKMNHLSALLEPYCIQPKHFYSDPSISCVMLRSLCKIKSSVSRIRSTKLLNFFESFSSSSNTPLCPTRIPTKCSSAHDHDHNPSTSTCSHHQEDDEYDPFLDPPMEQVKQVADKIRSSVREYTSKHPLKLVAITASRSFTSHQTQVDQGTDTYSEWISRTCQEDGIQFHTWRVAGGTSGTANQVQNLIERANDLPDVQGVLVCYPIYNHPYILGVDKISYRYGQRWSVEKQKERIEAGCEDVLRRNEAEWPSVRYKTRDDYFRHSISASRDVEGLSKYYHSRKLFRNQNLYVDQNDGRSDSDSDTDSLSSAVNDIIFPCTALAVVRILKQCLPVGAFDPSKPVGKRFENLTVTIINRSQIFGRPLASMLANDGANVYSVDKDSIVLIKSGGAGDGGMNRCFAMDKSVQECIQDSSVIVTGVPSSTFTVPSQWIQPGSTVINVASEPNVDVDELRDISGVQYVGQVGKVTVALLEHNLVRLHQLFHTK